MKEGQNRDCARCAYFDPESAACLVAEAAPGAAPGAGGGPCRYFSDAEGEGAPCLRAKECGRWWCLFDSAGCPWNDEEGGCAHPHPDSPAPLLEPGEGDRWGRR